jgi:hypothetical protein
MDDFGKDVGKSWRLSRLIPAYRATLLQIRRGGTNSRLVSLFLLESFLTKLISNLPKKRAIKGSCSPVRTTVQ